MKNINELVFNKFKKKSVGNKTQQNVTQEFEPHIEESPTDCIGWRMADNAEKPFIQFKITEEEIWNNLNEGRE